MGSKQRRRVHNRPGKVPPSWLSDGALVDYHSVIGGPVTRAGCTVEGDPFRSPSGHWVAHVSRVRGFVAIESLTAAMEV